MKLRSSILLAALVALSSGCKDKSQARKEEEALQKLEQSEEKLRKSLKEGMSEDGLTVDFNALEEQERAIKEAGEALGGKEGAALKAMAEIQGAANAQSRKLEAASQKMIEAIDWETLEKTGDYGERRETLRDVITENRKALAFFEGCSADLSRRLDAIDFTGRNRDDLERGFAESFGKTLPAIRQIRECDIEACEIGIRVLELLAREKGQWTWNAAEEVVEFDNDEALEAFEKEMTRFVEVGQKQLEVQNRIINGL